MRLIVRWSTNGFSGWRMPKANTTIAGREAAELRTSGGWCAPLRATGLPRQAAQISSMLRSVRTAKGD